MMVMMFFMVSVINSVIIEVPGRHKGRSGYR
jgi:hypothetical protein